MTKNLYIHPPARVDADLNELPYLDQFSHAKLPPRSPASPP
jgi:hypothetical protein